MRELLAWHSQVFTVTRPSPQWAKRLNWMAAIAFCASRKVDAHTRAINHFVIHSPCLDAAHCTAVIVEVEDFLAQYYFYRSRKSTQNLRRGIARAAASDFGGTPP